MALTDQPSDRATGGQQAAQGDDAPGDNQTSAIPLPVEQPASPNEAAVTDGQAQAEQHDLWDMVAQEIMADAGVWMAVAAFLTFAVTSIGTFLIGGRSSSLARR